MFFFWNNDWLQSFFESNIYQVFTKIGNSLRRSNTYRKYGEPPFYNQSRPYGKPPFHGNTSYSGQNQRTYGAPPYQNNPYYKNPNNPYQTPPQNTANNPYVTPPPAGSAGAYSQTKTAPKSKDDTAKENMLTIVKKSPAPFYAVGITWLISSLFAPMYSLTTYVILTGVSFVVYFLSSLIFRGTKVYLPAPPAPKEEKKQEPVIKTGNKEIDEMIVEGESYLKQLCAADVAIEDEIISEQIVQLEETTRRIFAFVSDNPKKLPQIRKFMNYYLPTTLKLLKSYEKLDKQGIKGENISSTMTEIEGIMHTIVLAFEKQLDALFQDDAMDISTDITVLEGMLAQDGFTDDKDEKSKKK